MDRRGFLSSVIALAAAPAIVRADSLMRVVPVNTLVAPVLTMPVIWGEQFEIEHTNLVHSWWTRESSGGWVRRVSYIPAASSPDFLRMVSK